MKIWVFCQALGALILHFCESFVNTAAILAKVAPFRYNKPMSTSTKSENINVIILCGGIGSRLWPLSRKSLPKQFLSLINGKSLFMLTLLRNQRALKALGKTPHFFVVTNERYALLAKEQAASIGVKLTALILEEVGKNTNPAIFFTSYFLSHILNRKADYKSADLVESDFDSTTLGEFNEDSSTTPMLILPADHLISNDKEYEGALHEALCFASGERADKGADANGAKPALVTFGITPSFISTGYGYIKHSGEKVEAFVEKPDYKTALSYINSGDYLFNSGMFCFTPATYLSELKTSNKELYNELLSVAEGGALEMVGGLAERTGRDSGSLAGTRVSRRSVACGSLAGAGTLSSKPIEVIIHDDQKIKDISIDYALLEKSKNIKVVKAGFTWSDVGSFDELAKNYQENSVNKINSTPTTQKSTKAVESKHNSLPNTGIGNIIAQNAHDNFIFSDSKKPISLIDTRGLIICDTADALLVCKKGSSQDVKKLIEKIRQSKDANLLEDNLVMLRPWGKYEVLLESARYKIKKITVKPGQRLSLQRHVHRNEHWIVVKGSALVRIDDEEMLLTTNESTYIPMGHVHRLSNIGKITLEIIEIQVGEYLGEDDIERLEDDYQRTSEQSHSTTKPKSSKSGLATVAGSSRQRTQASTSGVKSSRTTDKKGKK